jgi:hypothetical protein
MDAPGLPSFQFVTARRRRLHPYIRTFAQAMPAAPEGIRLTGKGKRKPEVELRWRDLLSGDAAMAVALNASLSKKRRAATKPATEQPPDRTRKRVPKKPKR